MPDEGVDILIALYSKRGEEMSEAEIDELAEFFCGEEEEDE